MHKVHSTKRSGLFSASGFRELASGRRRGAAATALRGILAGVEVPYSWAIRWRNRRYGCGASRVFLVEVPVISVGNLTLGGTGKTPMVEWIARQLIERRKKVGIISRGYGTRSGPNDEALELAWKLPGVPHVQNADRLVAARQAIDNFGCEVLVLDDAFQHRRIARDLDIVLLDALEPFGFEHVFPRGMLREPVEGLARAQTIVLSRADLISEQERKRLRSRVAMLAPAATWVEAIHAPVELITMVADLTHAGGTPALRQPLECLRGRRVSAFCAIGNPDGFRHTLTACGYEVVKFREFPDHYQYSQADLDCMAAEAQRMNVEAVVCTQKDLVKIKRDRLADRPLWAVRVGIEFLSGQYVLLSQLSSTSGIPA